jgi:hypothetical protein
VLAFVGYLSLLLAGARAFDDSKYPNLAGQWLRTDTGTPRFDPSKPSGRGQQAPLTPEYQAMLAASLADQANGGQGNWYSGARCLPPGMPATMNGYNSMEVVVLPEVTYVMVEHDLPIHRRIYTDGRDWPAAVEPTFQGYSIGRWIDSGATGHYDVLEAETRFFKGPRSTSHHDNHIQATATMSGATSGQEPGLAPEERGNAGGSLLGLCARIAGPRPGVAVIQDDLGNLLLVRVDQQNPVRQLDEKKVLGRRDLRRHVARERVRRHRTRSFGTYLPLASRRGLRLLAHEPLPDRLLLRRRELELIRCAAAAGGALRDGEARATEECKRDGACAK